MTALFVRYPTLYKLFAFGCVGVAATLTHFAVGLGLVGAGIATPFYANIIAFLTAFGVSYVGHRRFTFQSTTNHKTALPRFFAVAAGGLILNQIIVYLVVNLLDQSYILALIIVVSIVPVLIYQAGRFWVFRETAG